MEPTRARRYTAPNGELVVRTADEAAVHNMESEAIRSWSHFPLPPPVEPFSAPPPSPVAPFLSAARGAGSGRPQARRA
jgi:hypothetical protein